MSEHIVPVDNLLSLGWTQKEIELLNQALEEGVRPIADSLATQFYNLFIEGLTCREIAQRNKPIQERDILYLRWKNQWDQKRMEALNVLIQRVSQKLTKGKLEAADFLTTLASAYHKQYADQLLKYLQTGKEEDKPDFPSLKYYKEIIELLNKITGEDRKIQVDAVVSHSVNNTINENISQSEFLKFLANQNKNKQ